MNAIYGYLSALFILTISGCATTPENEKNLHLLKDATNPSVVSAASGAVNNTPLRIQVERGGLNNSEIKAAEKISTNRGEIILE